MVRDPRLRHQALIDGIGATCGILGVVKRHLVYVRNHIVYGAECWSRPFHVVALVDQDI